MKTGNVIGTVRAARRAACLEGQTFLLVRAGNEELVAADRVGAAIGDSVILATGSTAARYCMDAPVDAAVVAVVEEQNLE